MPCTTKFSYPQLMGWWVAHGGNPAAAPIAAAIAMAESGGCVDAVSPPNRDGTHDAGLWQVNSVNAPNAQMVDPVANVQEAIRLSGNGTTWAPWSTFRSGAYQKYLSGAAPSSSFPAGLTPGATLTGFHLPKFFDPGAGMYGPLGSISAPSSFGDIAKSVTGLLSAILKPIEYADAAALWLQQPRNWLRIIEVVGGLLVVAEGLHMLTGATPSPTKAVAGAASAAVPEVKATRAAQRTVMATREKRATTAAAHAERRRTVEHQHRQRRATEEHHTEQEVTRAEAKAAARRYAGHPSRSVRPEDREPGEEPF